MTLATDLSAPPAIAAASASQLWSSRLAFILAAVGSAVGLGNIWKFPYMVGTNGGGAFVLFYLGCVLVVGVPILIAEVMIGRQGGPSPMAALSGLARRYGGGRYWGLIGAICGGVVLLILSFYSVVAGWALAYVPTLAGGALNGADGAASERLFSELLANPGALLGWHTLFMMVVAAIVMRGIGKGIEAAVIWLIPMLFVLLIGLVGYAALEGDFAQGFDFLFRPDFSKLTPEAMLSAAGHAFFTLSVGLGAMIAYGGYLPAGVSIPRTAVIIAALDTVCALLAGLAIFPLVFANGLDPAGGPGLVFVTMPVAFGNMLAGTIVGAAFFTLLGIAALTSAVALLEPLVATAVARGQRRVPWTIGLGLLAWALGLISILSFNIWSDVRLADDDRTLFDWINYVTSDLLLPIGGIAFAIFAGWVIPTRVAKQELGLGQTTFTVWQVLVRYLAPAIILAVLGSLVLAG